MGKVELNVPVDEALVSDLEARGIDPLHFVDIAVRDAYDRARRWSLADSAKEKARDPEGASRRARQWAEENAEAIAERNRRIQEHGVFGEKEPFRARWMK